ncbi:MAG: ribonuclease P protein component, partial [Mycobacterium sp.]
MLPARNRMTRSTEFGTTINRGVRAVQPDIVVHARRSDEPDQDGPRVGLVVSKAVGNSVQRHRVSRRLRHVA